MHLNPPLHGEMDLPILPLRGTTGSKKQPKNLVQSLSILSSTPLGGATKKNSRTLSRELFQLTDTEKILSTRDLKRQREIENFKNTTKW